MGVAQDIQSVLESVLPSNVPQNLILSLSQDLTYLLNSGVASSINVDSTLQNYMIQVPSTPESAVRWKILKNMLEKLMQSNSQEELLGHLQRYQNSPTKSMGSFHSGNNQLEPSFSQKFNYNESIGTPRRDPYGYADSFENLDRFSEKRSFVASPPNNFSVAATNTAPLETLTEPYNTKLASDAQMLSYCYYTLLATTSDMFIVSSEKIDIPKNVSNSDSGILHLIFEAGMIYQFISKKIGDYKKYDISPTKKTFLVHIEQILREYTAFINQISGSNQFQSLKSLYYTIFDRVVQLRLIYTLFTSIHTSNGAELISKLNQLMHSGDSMVRDVTQNINESVLAFYLEYIINWMTLGKLISSYDEFFIEVTPNNSKPISESINNSKIPDFIPHATAKKIYIVGKTHIFLQKHCRELSWSNQLSRKYQEKYQAVKSMGISNLLIDTINEHYNEIVAYTNTILTTNFHLKKVLILLKQILLMGRGDMINVLIQSAENTLQQPLVSLSSYDLTRSLQHAVQKSSIRNWLNRSDNNFVINGLDARLLDLGHGTTGWESFTLDYVVDGPLSILLNVNREGGKKEYLRIFNFLWRFKKNSYFSIITTNKSNAIIRDLKKNSRNRPFIRDILNKISKISVLKLQLQTFNNKLQQFCFEAIIQKEYDFFRTKLGKSERNCSNDKEQVEIQENRMPVLNEILKPKGKLFESSLKCNRQNTSQLNIDEIEQLHDEFLAKILSHKLLASSSANYIGQFTEQLYSTSIILLLNMTYDFMEHYSALLEVTHEILIHLNLHGQQELGSLLERFNTIIINISNEYKRFKEYSNIFIKDMRYDGSDVLAKLGRYLK